MEKQNSNLVSQLECETTNLENECGRSDLVSQNALQKKQASNVVSTSTLSFLLNDIKIHSYFV